MTTIRFKRSVASTAYPALVAGEPAYSEALPGQMAIGTAADPDVIRSNNQVGRGTEAERLNDTVGFNAWYQTDGTVGWYDLEGNAWRQRHGNSA